MRRLLTPLTLIGLTLASATTAADTLLDAQALATTQGIATWPLVDARELSERSRQPIPGALDPGSGLTLSGPVLILGSDPESARRVARELEQRIPGLTAYVPAGGVEDLRALRPELGGVAPAGELGAMPGTFTIPRDTCQPGQPAHVFTDEKAP